MFPKMKHLLCTNHFCKNIEDKMKYRLPKSTTAEQRRSVLELFNGAGGGSRGLLDSSTDEIKEKQKKVIKCM